ncbi:di-heme-cytochrome C peroxidase [Nitrosomonas cryotolerans]|uniref:di-heme-cytochrome C peroxidase n=1 Tax=Nitrosomonas cryotolerans TaxID=44575 RepID=UPI00210DB357|nr:di-heme-cytochrome C peroxidase [Nitrosomonas cryotolerans]
MITFEQGWTQDQRLDFYNTSQGSQLIPYSWFMALEQSDTENLFRAKENIEQLGYIPQQKIPGRNPDGLPIGFVKDDIKEDFLSSALYASRLSSSDEAIYKEYREWLGLTCAACHTSEITHNKQTLRIDGGPPMADFQTMIKMMSKALTATTSDGDKLARFAKNVLADGGYNETEQQRLKAEVIAYTAWLNNYIQINYHGAMPYGYGRLDAFGAILNRVTASFTGIEDNATPSNAPVSYPFLWNTSQLSWVQWNGSANNHISRNVGEVSGVFAHTIVDTPNDDERFYSSAKIVNLDQLEQLMSKLDSPKWGAPLPAIDATKAAKGEALFAANCVMCHSIRDKNGEFPMTAPNQYDKQFIKITRVGLPKIGTDPLMAGNFVNPVFNVDPGVMREYLPPEDQDKPKVARAKVLSAVVGNVIYNRLAASNPKLSHAEIMSLILELGGFYTETIKPEELLAYKARPLNGVWATAPYLHNGSVSSLYQLLLSDTEREKSFYVGSRELDTKQVGFEPNQDGNSFLFNTVDKQGKPIPGNSNLGHSGPNYTQTQEGGEWRDYTSEERYQLIEYMKTL